MAEKKVELFWLGPGVIKIGGGEFGAGVPLPVDKMGKGVLDNQMKKGNIGKKIAPVGANDLETVNVNLTTQLEEANKKIADLTKELEDSQKELEEATKPKDGK